MKKRNTIRLFSLLLVLLLLAVPLLSSCNGEMPEATTPPTGGVTNEGTGCVTNEGTGGVISKDATVGNVWKQYVMDPSVDLSGNFSIFGNPIQNSDSSPICGMPDEKDVASAMPTIRSLEKHVIEAVASPENWSDQEGKGELVFRPVSAESRIYISIELHGTYMKITNHFSGESKCFRMDIDLTDTIEQINTLLNG